MREPTISRAEFERLVAEHEQLIGAVNDLEYRLYRLGEGADHLTACRQAAGALIGLLRDHLFRQDQQVLPLLDRIIPPDAPSGGRLGGAA
jgi:hemerythrin-like domain-containing protein